MNLFNKPKQKPAYLERIDQMEKVQIVRLKGDIDQNMVPVIEARIRENRKREGVVIDKNIIIDYAHVGRTDSAAIAFHMVRLKEIEAAGHKVGFININQQVKTYLDMFKQSQTFKIYGSEEAIKELNQ